MPNDKKLCRSSKNRMIAGVAGGFAEYFNIDPTVVRLIFVLAAFGGPGIPFYLIAWLLMPAENKQ